MNGWEVSTRVYWLTIIGVLAFMSFLGGIAEIVSK